MKKYYRTRVLVVMAIITVMLVSMLANENSGISGFFVNDIKKELNIVKINGYDCVPINDVMKLIDPESKKFIYYGNYAIYNITVDNVSYKILRNSQHYYKNGEKIRFETHKENGVNYSSSYKTSSMNSNVYMPIHLLLDFLNVNYEIKNSALYVKSDYVKTPATVKLNEFGRIDFNFKEDDISTTAGKKAFTEKYKLGGYAKAEEIPTYYDLFNVSPSINSPKRDNVPTCQWSKDELNFYLSNPPTLLGQDGSKPPFGKGIDVLVQWIIDNDKWVYGEVKQPFVHQDGSYIMGQTKITGNEFFELYDNSNSPSVLLAPNARIKTQNESPLSSVYIKMILRNYVGEQYVNNAYKIAIFEPVKFQSVYFFGDVELYFDDVSSVDSKRIQIGEPGYKTSELKKVAEYDIALLLGKKAIKPIYYDKYISHPNPPENYNSPNFKIWN